MGFIYFEIYIIVCKEGKEGRKRIELSLKLSTAIGKNQNISNYKNRESYKRIFKMRNNGS
jgi:hypothetical protein